MIIQEHENGSLGKTECWYILDSEPGTQIVIGHYAKDKEELKQMVEEKRWKDLIGSACKKRRFLSDRSWLCPCH